MPSDAPLKSLRISDHCARIMKGLLLDSAEVVGPGMELSASCSFLSLAVLAAGDPCGAGRIGGDRSFIT